MVVPIPKPEILKSIHSFILLELIPPTAKHLVFLGSISLIESQETIKPMLLMCQNFQI